jgi:CHAD domain-containing protein
MTPELAGFVVPGETEADWNEAVDAVVAALQSAFAVQSGHAPGSGDMLPRAGAAGGEPARGTERRTWFDTFDWRLYRAGLLLEYVPGHRGSSQRGGELRLVPVAAASPAAPPPAAPPPASTAPANAVPRAAPTSVLVQPVVSWHASRPHWISEIPSGAVAGRIGALIAPRVLLPVATVATKTMVRRLLNEDGKTVARLLVEHSVVTGAGRPVSPRIAITEVRGYAGAARRAAGIVEDTIRARPAVGAAFRRSLFREAASSLGREPGGYTGKINAAITGQMPAAQAVAVILLCLLDTLEANTQGVLLDLDTEFLHDFRVAVRRGRAAIKLFGDALPDTIDIAWFAAEFKWLGDLTTPTRDLDVHLLGFDDMAARLRAAKADDLEAFRDYLTGRRAREARLLARGLRSERFRDLTRSWRAALTPVARTPVPRTPAPSASNPAAAARPAPASLTWASLTEATLTESAHTEAAHTEGSGTGETVAGTTGRSAEKGTAATLAAARTRRAFAKVSTRGAAITPDSPHESLHDLRKRCKELRYALEFFAPVHDPAAQSRVIGDLKRLQDCLGDFQDSEVQIAEIQTLAAAMQAEAAAPSATLLAMGELTAGLADAQAAARADFERRFTAFAGAEGKRRMSLLPRGGAA